ncbi:MAG: fimbrillin family protein [Prevotella sp.]|jgi:hypothetical protein
MKKTIMTLAGVALIISACSSESDQESVDLSQNMAMTFSTQSLTRASEKSAIDEGDMVGVFGYQDTLNWNQWTDKTANLMFNQKMTADASANLSYSPVRYWVPGYYYTFFAYYPFTATSSSADDKSTPVVVTSTLMGQGEDVIVFNTPGKSGDQIDFMVSDLITDQSYDGSTSAPVVSFTLHHLLASISFWLSLEQVNTSYSVTQIDSVVLSGIHTRGLYNVENGTWVLSDTSTVRTDSYTASTDDNARFLLLPQEVPDSTKLTLWATYSGGSTTRLKVSAYLKDLNISEWTQGISTLYTLKPEESNITYIE